jgi:hypothetical protein
MKTDYYFDDLDIENYFISGVKEDGVIPTEPGLVNTKPAGVRENTAPRMNADGELKDKLKAFVKSKKGKTILKITAGIGGAAVIIAFGPEIMAALAPLLPAMKSLLAKKGIPTKGAGDVVKKFHETQIGPLPKDASSGAKAKNIVTGILKFFKNAKDRKAAGTQSPIDDLILNKADETIQKISDGTLGVEKIIADPTNSDTPGKPGDTTDTTGSKKTGIDMKIILVAIVAVFLFAKK